MSFHDRLVSTNAEQSRLIDGPVAVTIRGECPACKGKTLFVGSGGYITCSYLSCPDPTAPSKALKAVPHD